MSMSMRFKGGQLELNIAQLGERAVKGMSERMRKHAIRVRDLARDYSPVKTGLLERSIDYATIRSNRRNAYVVFIDLDAVRASGDGQLGDYAFIMHDELHPHGRQRGERHYSLGAGSVAKAASGKKVGGRFLARAIKDANKNLMADLVGECRRVMGGSSSVGVQYQREENEE